ncbi:hypothetical protein [Rothia nasimurium]|uniref:hypothetical protein n=1 Tax=Rothia nasimurium TaxID=85336 RepID=UPI001626AE42|nr:hypothetical protein [Rothia nasimurium]
MNNSADQNIEQNTQQTQAEQKTSWVKSKTTRLTALIGCLEPHHAATESKDGTVRARG